jgi:prepilin-type processing-associated H-X9-DG protein
VKNEKTFRHHHHIFQLNQMDSETIWIRGASFAPVARAPLLVVVVVVVVGWLSVVCSGKPISASVPAFKCKSAVAVWNATCLFADAQNKDEDSTTSSFVTFSCIGAEYQLTKQRKNRRVLSAAAEYIGLGCEYTAFHKRASTTVQPYIAIMERGVCPFAAKALFAQRAGYKGAIVINPTHMPPIVKAGFGANTQPSADKDTEVTLPVVFVEERDAANSVILNKLRDDSIWHIQMNISMYLDDVAACESCLFETATIMDNINNINDKNKVNNNKNNDDMDNMLADAALCAQDVINVFESSPTTIGSSSHLNAHTYTNFQRPSNNTIQLLAADAHLIIAEGHLHYTRVVDADLAAAHYHQSVALTAFTHLPAITNFADMLYKYVYSPEAAHEQNDVYQDDLYTFLKLRAQELVLQTLSERFTSLLDINGSNSNSNSSLQVSFKKEFTFGIEHWPDDSPAQPQWSLVTDNHDNSRVCYYEMKVQMAGHNATRPVVIQTLSPELLSSTKVHQNMCRQTEAISSSNYEIFPRHQRYPFMLTSDPQASASPDTAAPAGQGVTTERSNKFSNMAYVDGHIFTVQIEDCMLAGPAGIPITFAATATGVKATVFISSADSLLPLHVLEQLQPTLETHGILPALSFEQLSSSSLLADENTYMYVPGVVISGLQMSSDNYYHFITQSLPRIILSLRYVCSWTSLSSLQHVSIVIPGHVDTRGRIHLIPFIMDALQLVGIHNNTEYHCADASNMERGVGVTTRLIARPLLSSLRAEKLLLVDWRWPMQQQLDNQTGAGHRYDVRLDGLELSLPRHAALLLHNEFLYHSEIDDIDQAGQCVDDGSSSEDTADRVIFISRGQGRVKTRKHRPEPDSNGDTNKQDHIVGSGRSRHILNEADAVESIRHALATRSDPLSRNRKVEVVVFHAEDHSLRDTVAVFRRADVIVGVHGAGLTNMLFASSPPQLLHAEHSMDPRNGEPEMQTKALCQVPCSRTCRPATAVVG